MSGSISSYKILHLTDLNIDYKYVAGSSSDCGELICCQAKHGTEVPVAETYGNHNCDTSSEALDKMLASIAAAQTPNLIIITGGLVSRDPSLTPAEALASVSTTLAKIAAAFPGVQTYIALGATELAAF